MADQINYSKEELDKIKRRAEIRARLKHEFYAVYRNPLKQAYKVETYDPAVQRFVAASYFKAQNIPPKARYGFLFLGIFIGLPLLSGYITRLKTDPIEMKIRTGEITMEQRVVNRDGSIFK